MQCASGNATPACPATAPGIEHIDPRAVAREVGRRGMDPRVLAAAPGFDAPFFQAGLAGYSDAAMRIVARRNGCPFCVTEALLDRSLLDGGHGFDKADLQALADNVPGGEEDYPISGQIIGSEPDEMAAAAVKMIEQAKRPGKAYRLLAQTGGARVQPQPADADHDAAAAPNGGSRPAESSPVPTDPREARTFTVIDVNLACPVKKIKNKARGGHWLCVPEGAEAILRAVRQATPSNIATTVKLRRSYDDTPEMARAFERVFNAAYELGYAWATVHGRTVDQKYVGPSRWDVLRDLVRRHPDKVIFGSGDVWRVDDIFRLIGYTGVTGASVARGCIGNPWIFRQAREMMAGREPTAPTIAEQRNVLRQHFALSVAINGEKAAGKMMRKFGIRFAQHHPHREEVRQRMIAVEGVEDWENVLAEWYGDEMEERAGEVSGVITR